MCACRWKLFLSAIVFAGAVAFMGSSAWAQTLVESLFELDGNVIDETAIDDPDDSSPPDDWAQNNFNDLGPNFLNCTPNTENSCGYVAGPPEGENTSPGGQADISTFINDPNGDTGIDDIFIGGQSKDDLPIEGWKWTLGGPPDKDDLLQVGAAGYIPNAELLIYDFGSLFSANGDSSIGNWFFKRDIGPCSDGTFGVVDSSQASRPCLASQPSPLHTVGDALIISENTNGGTETNISLYIWVGGDAAECTSAGGTLVPPKDNLCLIGTFAGATCDGTPDAGEFACGIMNQMATESSDDYGYLSKFPPAAGPADPTDTDGIGMDDYPAFVFFESGINITEELGAAECFSSFLKNTRTSASVRSQLKDFASSSFGLCSITGSKVCTPDPDPSVCAFDSSSACTVDADCDQVGVCSDNGEPCTTADKSACDTPGSASCDDPVNDSCIVEGFCADNDAIVCTVANEDTVCVGSPGDKCVVANPYIDSDGLTIVMQNDIAITNDGIGTLFDVELKEDMTFDTGEFCDITAVNGLAVGPVDLTDNAFHRVPANGVDYDQTLATSATVTVTVTCETGDNPFANQVDIRAATEDVDNGGSFTLFEDNVALDTTNDNCQAPANPMIDLSKACVDVRLMSTGSELVVEVLTEITVTNTGDEQLINVSVTDDVGGTVASGETLNPGQSLTLNVVDMPSAPGQSAVGLCTITGGACTVDGDCDTSNAFDTCDITTKYNPDDASFTNTANASGDGAISGNPANATPASPVSPCRLCPAVD